MKTKKIIAVFIIIAMLVLPLSGCYDSNEIENLAYAIAVGIDKGQQKEFKLTFQIVVPTKISGGGEESLTLKSFETDNILSGLKNVSESISRQINLSHAKLIVFSEDIAKDGLSCIINGLVNTLEIRPTANIIISTGSAYGYLDATDTNLSLSPSKYYELLFKSYEKEFYTPSIQLNDFVYKLRNSGTQPIAILCENNSVQKDSAKSKQGSISGIKGLAVFKGDKLVAELDHANMSIFSLLTKTNENVNMIISDPQDSKYKVLSIVRTQPETSYMVKIEDGIPKISILLYLKGNIVGVQGKYNYLDEAHAVLLENAYREDILDKLKAFLAIIAYQDRTDIVGFGDYAKRSFLTQKQWERFDWNNAFAKAQFHVEVKFRIDKSGNMLNETVE